MRRDFWLVLVLVLFVDVLEKTLCLRCSDAINFPEPCDAEVGVYDCMNIPVLVYISSRISDVTHELRE